MFTYLITIKPYAKSFEAARDDFAEIVTKKFEYNKDEDVFDDLGDLSVIHSFLTDLPEIGEVDAKIVERF